MSSRTEAKPSGRTCRGRRIAAWVLALILALAPVAFAGKLETWKQEGATAFQAGKREGVVATESGRLRLGQSPVPSAEGLEAAEVWDLAAGPDGTVYAATGNQGRVYRRAGGGGPWVAFPALGDPLVLALAVGPGGEIVCGTGPGGLIAELAPGSPPPARPGPDVQYIWDLAFDGEGNLYAATGPSGQLWKRQAGVGRWVLVLDSRHTHLLCLAVSPRGEIFAGSDGEGLVYRITRDGQVSVLFDAPQAEVRCLALGPDGALHAGTAAPEAGSGSRTTRLMQSPSSTRRRVAYQAPGGSAASKPPAAGENAVYRIDENGATRELFRGKTLILSLAWQGERLLVGTGPQATLYELRDQGREVTALARLEQGQLLALLPQAAGATLLGTGSPGTVLVLPAGYSSKGSFTSSVHDARLRSRFGASTWKAVTPEGSAVALRFRSGNVSEPDATWSGWSDPVAISGASVTIPPARFVQYQATLTTSKPGVTPELIQVNVPYQTVNLAPELSKITIPDLAEGDGATRQASLALKWTASDPNSDDLEYRLYLRKDGWPAEVAIDGTKRLTEAAFTWDTTSAPSGQYTLRVEASDAPSNPADQALRTSLTSEPFLVDHEPPALDLKADGDTLRAVAADALTRITQARMAIDGGEWKPLFAADGLFDGKTEQLPVSLPELPAGSHLLRIQATDAAGNSAAVDRLVDIPAQSP